MLWPHEELIDVRVPQRMSVRLKDTPVAKQAKTETPPEPQAAKRKSAPRAERQVLAVPSGGQRSQAVAPKWTAAQKAEMDSFLNELENNARRRPPPTLAERAVRQARESAVAMEREEDKENAILELKPNAPPPDPMAAEMYIEGIIRQLNRHAAFVKKPGKERGKAKAMVTFRLNPDGSLKAFKVDDPGDQGEEIEFIRAIVERAAPFARFPADLGRSVSSVGLVVCINPRGGESGKEGFQRLRGNRC